MPDRPYLDAQGHYSWNKSTSDLPYSMKVAVADGHVICRKCYAYGLKLLRPCTASSGDKHA